MSKRTLKKTNCSLSCHLSDIFLWTRKMQFWRHRWKHFPQSPKKSSLKFFKKQPKNFWSKSEKKMKRQRLIPKKKHFPHKFFQWTCRIHFWQQQLKNFRSNSEKKWKNWLNFSTGPVECSFDITSSIFFAGTPIEIQNFLNYSIFC